jgi:hypothetical protein
MSTAALIALLQSALLLLKLAQGPAVGQALHDQAVQIANQAIAAATAALSASRPDSVSIAGTSTLTDVQNFLPDRSSQNECPYFFPPDCARGALVSNGSDVNGCSLGYHCVVTATTSPEVCASGSCVNASSTPALACTLGAVTLQSGQSYAFYSLPFSEYCDGISQIRTCYKGVLDGDFRFFYPFCSPL